jgi:arylsulfatase A-like enzyme
MKSAPNILHIICHDLGRHLGCYGRPEVRSPNLDRLAGEGVKFENCFTASPPCSPARGCLMTGRYAHCTGQIGLSHRGFPLPEEEPTLVDYLNEAGYLTANLGVQHERRDPRKNRYRVNDQASPYCEVAAAKAADFLAGRARSAGEPFYLNVGFFEVHLPFTREVYAPGDPAEVAVPGWLPDNRPVREELARFHGAISFMDEAVGVIVGALEAAGLEEETVVMFTTDHGMAFPRAKGMLYDPGIGVALIIRMAGGEGRAGAAAGELVSSIDVAPTLLELAGVARPEAMQGRSFLGLLRGERHEEREFVFSEKNYHDCYDPIRGLRSRRYKYLRNFEPRPRILLATDMKRSPASEEMWPWAKEPRPREELYDLERDPYEMENLAGGPEMGELKARLSAQLERWMEESDDPLRRGPVPAPAGAKVDPPDLPVGGSN